MTVGNKFHFIGIGGIGMSGLARILVGKQCQVTGSDIAASYVTEGLIKAGVKVFMGHSPQNIADDATVVYSTDIKKTNSEYAFALQKGIPTLHRSELLASLMKDSKNISVAGTHGKTTTSALLAWVLKKSGLDPSFAVGGLIPDFKSNAGFGSGEYFVAEADESDGTFLKYNPFAAIVTNIDEDHLNYYGNFENLITAFKQFISQVTSTFLFWCGDDEELSKINPKGVSYGFQKHCQLKISNAYQKGWTNFFDVNYLGKTYQKIELSLIGKHNILNAAAIFGLCLSLGVSEQDIRDALKTFQGVQRRAEKKAEIQSILLLDDYAHHPTEIKTTLAALKKAAGGRRVVAVFQPHRYSRTKDCLGAYKNIFKSADVVFVTDIYAAGEEPDPTLSPQTIIDELESDGTTKYQYADRSSLAKRLSFVLRTHDVVITLGAGDITKLSQEILDQFRENPPKKLKVGILYGGRSTEHEISLKSADHFIDCVKSDIYDVDYFGITKNGHWIYGKESLNDLKKSFKSQVSKSSEEMLSGETLKAFLACDVLIPVFHGPLGEDGTIQGLFEIFNKAYVGPDQRSASIAMDKALTKHLMIAHHIPTLPFVEFNQFDWEHDECAILEKINATLSYPVFVKPVHLGSTVGVKKVLNKGQLKSSIEESLTYDYKLIVEAGLTSLREIEFAMIGNDDVLTFPPGEIIAEGKFYDFEAKYGMDNLKATSKADLSDVKKAEGMDLAIKAYKAIGCSGMARVDFFLDHNEKFFLNEINPIPGFTSISLYPKICEANNIGGKELLDRLIVLALERNRKHSIFYRDRFSKKSP